MTKGKLISAVLHVAGVLIAFFIVWFVPPTVWGYFGEEAAPFFRNGVFIALFVWGAYKLFQILQGTDELSNKTAAFLDNKTKK